MAMSFAMNPSHWAAFAFAGAAVFAVTHSPLVFHVKLNHSMVPLSGRLGDEKSNTTFLVWGGLLGSAVAFTYQSQYAVLAHGHPENAGFFRTIFSFGPTVFQSRLLLDDSMRVTGHAFVSCRLPNSSLNVIASYGKILPCCFDVDVYLMPLNTSADAANKATPLLVAESLHHPAVFPHLPLVFFARLNGTFVPLSEIQYSVDGVELLVLARAQEAFPVYFMLVDNYAISTSAAAPGFVSFHNGLMIYGPTSNPALLMLGNDMSVQNLPFSSCEVFGEPRHWIVNTNTSIPTKNCFDVDIFLLPYNEHSGSVLKHWHLPTL